MEEAGNRVDEKPSTHKKKVQIWLFVTVGLVTVILFIWTVADIATRANQKVVEPAAATPAPQNSNTSKGFDKDFDQLITERRLVQRNNVAQETSGPASSTPQQIGYNPPSGADSQTLAEYNKQWAQRNGIQPQAKAEPSPAEKVQDQWQAQERMRALQSAQSEWGLSFGNQQSTAKAAGPSGPGLNNLQSQVQQLGRPLTGASEDERRTAVSKRIREAQALRERLLSGSVAPSDVMSAVRTMNGMPPDIQQTSEELKTLSQGFSPPPANVAGYTAENSYNADIEGKIKLPPGTVIPTTLMWKSISDYTGGPLTSLVSHDVYDYTHQFVVIPKGTKVNISGLKAAGVNEAINNRMAFIVKDAVLPNNDVIDFGKAAAVDREGVGALKDQVEYHFLAQFLGVAAYALVADSSSYSSTGTGEASYAGDVGSGVRAQVSPLVQKYLNIVPTVTIRPGQSFRVVLEDTLYVKPWKDTYESYYQ
ncbi:TrbI/VirB10 family protein [Pokkaliibacter plantistimulans]|uniref:TrbI/VirB10 family protein n=1 Tax=Pokkaliibacter plantistimulans TaxID=1635171 RepID=UPI000D744968|nr:TrbI/VirB10 family protein [Pokkaliibacter plantistimulans]